VSEILQAVSRASKRSSAVVHEELRVGVYGLATIASLAPWVGLFGTVLGIFNSFRGTTGPRVTIMAAIAGQLSESLWFTAFGLAVGLMSLWFYRYLTEKLRTIDLEMENASLDLLNQLSRIPGRFAIAPAVGGPMFGEESPDELKRDEKFQLRSRYVAAAALVLASCIQAWLSWSISWIYIPLTFGLSCLPAYPLWVKLLRRKPGGLIALASVICLFWSVAELVLGRHLP
jgi:MotA/TolQ/ExbB proton channel family